MFRLCVIMNMVRFKVCCNVVIRLLNLLVLMGLRLEVGLLRKMIFGFRVSVWVRVVCLIMLLDSFEGSLLVVFGFRFIILILSMVSLLSSWFDRCRYLCMGIWMFCLMVRVEKSVFCWNSMF